MSQGQSVSRVRTWASLAGMIAIVASCSDAAHSPLMPHDALQASPANNSGGPSVAATTPATGEQGTVSLQVTIDGNGFATGAVASWERNGVPDPKVTVKSTQFVNPKKVIATIDIALDADITSYDVAVMNTDRKKGIGTAIFAVTGYHGNQAPAVPLVVTVVTTPNLASDGVTEAGYAAGEYVSGRSGMVAELDGPGNLQFSPANANSSVAPLRTLAVTYGAQLTAPAGAYNPNLYMSNQHNFKILTRGLNGNPRIQDLADGASGCYPVTIATESGGTSSAVAAYHHRAEYNPVLSTGTPASSYVRVTHTGGVWTMASDGTCGGPVDVAAFRSQDLTRKNQPLTYRGNFAMQIALTFRLL